MAEVRKLIVEGPAGNLEVMVEMPATAMPKGVAVVCHPHPLYEGSMHNKVVHTLSRALQRLDCVGIRFNFRGVGSSEGAFADGLGELEDARALCRWARQQWPNAPLVLGGFSFGAAVALGAAPGEQPVALITVAPPVGRLIDRATVSPGCPWLIVQGDADELVNYEDVMAWVNELEPGPELAIVSGVDHFFHGRLVELRDLVTDFLHRQVPSLASDD